MAPINCCSFRRAVSPDPQPAVLIDTSQTGGRFALSSHTPSRAGSQESVSNVQPIQKIFSSANRVDVAPEVPSASANDIALAHETEPSVRHKDSSRRLHDVANILQKRMSRDSGMHKRNSKPRLRSSLSDDDHRRRDELKRALHQRVQNDIDEGSNISDVSYDEDAVPIKTPGGTLGRHEGSIQLTPRHLSNALRRSESPSAYAELDPRIVSQIYGPKNTAVALSRMLTQRGNSLVRDSEEQAVDLEVAFARRPNTAQRYSFTDEDGPIQVSRTRSHSILGRSNTVLYTPFSTKALEIDVIHPEYLDTPGAPFENESLTIRPDRSHDSATWADSRVSIADVRQGASSGETKEIHRSTLGSPKFPGIYDTKIRPASEQLLHGNLGSWGRSVHSKHSNTNSTTDSHTSSSNGHFCNPASEEMSFGGTDGEYYTPPTSETYAGPPSRQRGRSEGSDPVHLYNMHIPQRLASKSLLPSVSLPQMEYPRRDMSYTSGSSSRLFSVIPRGQPSSLIAIDDKQSKTPATHVTSSSVYSSGSLPPSPLDSSLRINSLSHQLYQLEMIPPNEYIVGVPASRPKSVDLDNLERRTVETSYHSSNESLMNRELAASETRISPLPRANTLPKNSRFREDLDRISAELALTNPPRRRVSNLDGTRSPDYEDATSAWERALREHSQEDGVTSHTRIGSTASNLVGPRQLDPKTAESSGPRARKQSSSLSTDDRRIPAPLEGADLQAHLSAYKLPPRRENSHKRPKLDGIKGSPPTIGASSWARYPSHTRPERSSSPAGLSDQVYSRDFAVTSPSTMPKVSPERRSSPSSTDKKGTAKAKTFGQQVLSTISSLYKSQSQELQRRLANEARGHRSSVSEGGAVEYPELEMLGSISPPLPSPDIATKLQLEERVRNASRPQGGTRTDGPSVRSGKVSRKQSQDWAREYQDFIQLPTLTKWPIENSTVPLRDHEHAEGLKDNTIDDVASLRAVFDASDLRRSSAVIALRDETSGESDVRGSTLDFKRSLELV